MEIGQILQRTWNKHPDKTDGFINIDCGATYKIVEVHELSIQVQTLSSSMPAFVGGEMSIPMRYLQDDTYYTKVA